MGMAIKDLAHNPKNPRKITDKRLSQLKKALHEFGDLGAFVFNRTTKTLVGGHQRTKVFPPDDSSRFFYVAKPSASEKHAGTEDGNGHPTVKPIKLMEYLIRMVTPPGGTVLDPFMGSGTTGIAAIKNDFKFFGIDQEKKYTELAKNRMLGLYSVDEKKLKAKRVQSRRTSSEG